MYHLYHKQGLLMSCSAVFLHNLVDTRNVAFLPLYGSHQREHLAARYSSVCRNFTTEGIPVGHLIGWGQFRKQSHVISHQNLPTGI